MTLLRSLALGALALVVSAPAFAQTACGERGVIADRLAQRFGESPTSIGLATNGSVIEMFASKDGTFTILVTSPDGKTYLVAAGEAWQWIGEKPADHPT